MFQIFSYMGKHFGIGLGISLIAYTLARGIYFHQASITFPAFYLTYAILFLVAALLFLPTVTFDPKQSKVFIPIWFSVNFMCFLLVLTVVHYGDISVRHSFSLAIGVSILILLFSTVMTFLTTLVKDHTTAAYTTLLFLGICTTAPLWLGPLVEQFANNQRYIDLSIAISPLSYLAVTIDYDYLRSDWFYRSTPYGGLRYNYPTMTTYTTINATISAALLLMVQFAPHIRIKQLRQKAILSHLLLKTREGIN